MTASRSTPSTSRPAPRRPPPTRATSASTARTPDSTTSACTCRSTTTAARRPTATSRCRPIPQATAASATRSRTPGSSKTGSTRGTRCRSIADAEVSGARNALLAELREHALIIGDVTLSSGKQASYYVDARRALMRPAAFRAAGELIAGAAADAGAVAVGGPTTGAIPLACAAISADGGSGLAGFFVRKERKEHGLQRWIEGAVTEGVRCLVVEDTVTTGGSVVTAIARIRSE